MRITVGRKLLLIALVSLVPLMLSSGLWFEEIHARVAQLQRERTGLLAHRELRRVMGAMAAQREGGVRNALEGKPLDPADAATLQRMIGDVEAAVARGGTDAEAATVVAAMRGDLDSVARAIADGNAGEAWLEYSEALARLAALMSHVANASGIVVDGDPATFFLSRIVIDSSPPLLARLSDARSIVQIAVANGKMTPYQSSTLRGLIVLAQADMKALGAYSRDLERAAPEIAARANKPLPDVMVAAKGLLDNLESFSQAGAENARGFEWVYTQDRSIPKILEANDRLHFELTKLLDARAEELSTRRDVLIGVNLGVVGIAALFAFFLMRSVRTSITNAAEVAHRVAGGDLTQVVEIHGSDETARLMRSLNHMTQGLARMVGEVRASSETIGSDVRSLAEGNRDLSSRTESQSSAIEEAAAAMEQLTASVRQNRDTAKETQRIAGFAGDATSRGIEAASRVVDSMESIRGSTQRVGEIVGMIDSIAFQTNILALNAAVEAARAGEHGRGFAVVAAEVRNLARRCADSAREIKGLVHGASEQVTGGAKLVEEVSEAIADINARVAEVGQLMNRIVSASGEQASGIDQVGQTIVQMERATQQNAALVEEIVAATESLSQQTLRLGSLVGVFRLEGASAGRPAAAPAPDTRRAATGVRRVSPAEPKLALPDR